MAFQILVRYDAYPHIIQIFLSLYEFILLRNWNQSNRITQNKVMAFSCQLVGLPILPEGQFERFIFQCLVSIFDTGSWYSFKYKVLRVLLQLESPNSEHRNSSYVRNNPDYSMFKTEIRIWLAHGPTLSEFLGHLEKEFYDYYFFRFGYPRSLF